ncbi:UDP-N-acetylmuramyl pentapeptide phosphotransferase/UDP-N-acetylglucosamine-1-phosphate transferase [Tibeticola sediminis]|uniref:UDP-N-acetylmuramyl pentapeptide phosphotransferase/UDP-N-acetylglucosamine-1-phosphate transferase n=1 Tax=Tibeticola sediminis TaxID=1917811 RepID=A0A3N4V0A1_9BURK|nr:MraY family glycosyltransferase [Tibeticola sediminis]RPE73219.1 UDP-N-acetylmuramyl pentapeptide phosphotransferase/UDP-N-acetylglucosamine-1-phosphate transferase [Tibeticola sediminis]
MNSIGDFWRVAAWAGGGAFLASLLTAGLIVGTRGRHLHLTGDRPGDGPQKQHDEDTPRIGGVAVAAGLAAAAGIDAACLGASLRGAFPAGASGWLLALLPLLLLGLTEDVRKSLSVRLRLAVAIACGAAAWWLAGVRIEALGIGWVDAALAHASWLSLGVTAVAVAGLVHAMNIVDGLHGLLAGIALTVLMAVAAVAWRYGDLGLFSAAIVTVGAVAGFAVFNFPRGVLFCGDGGAYLIGFVCASLLIVLVRAHPTVSPWFALAAALHPVTETLYSAWRRFRAGHSPTAPDARHFHSLWSAWLAVRQARGERIWGGPNAGAAWRTVVFAAMPPLFALGFETQTYVLQVICVAYVVAYLAWTKRLEQAMANAERSASIRRG